MQTAERLLRESQDAAAVSMDAVAAAAGVTRLTLYKQFGSRRALLEAVFDLRAAAGGLARIPEAMAIQDPQRALGRLVEIFCSFWANEPAVGRLQGLAASDPDFAEAIDARNERRRQAIKALLRRSDAFRKGVSGRDLADLIFTLTSYATYSSLKRDRSESDTCKLIKSTCAALLEGAGRTGDHQRA